MSRAGVDERVKERFPRHYTVEISVLDGSGDPFEVYAGPVVDVTAAHFTNVFREPGCFYIFTVIGIPTELLDAVDVHHSNIRRAEFMWLTEPAPPRLVEESSFCAVVGWSSYRFCGINPHVPPGCLKYVFEMAEGCEWKDGKVGSRYVTDLTVKSYRQLLVLNEPKNALKVTDLQPGFRYFARIAIEYHGERVVSEAICFHTPSCEPSAPGKPRAYVSPVVNKIDPSIEHPPNIMLNWSSSKSNGDEIIKYQVFMQQVVLSAHYVDSAEPYSPLFAKKLKQVKGEKKILRGGQWVSLRIEPKVNSTPTRPTSPEYRDNTLVFTTWARIYSNLDRKVKLSPPPLGTVEWRFRVRAKNSRGWSEFGPVLCLHNRTHPALFLTEYPPDYEGQALERCSYLPSSPTPLQLDESIYVATSALQLPFQQYHDQLHCIHHQQEQSLNNMGVNISSGSSKFLKSHKEQNYEEAFPFDEELIEASDRSGFTLRRPRATSALPSTSHDRRESFSSEAGGGGISAPNSRVIDDHGSLDTHSGLLSGDRNAIGSRGRSAGARL